MQQKNVLTLACCVTSTLTLIPSVSHSAPRDTLSSFNKKIRASDLRELSPIKSTQPPCAVKPSLEFLDDEAPGTSQSNLVSAAWFARAVQLPTQNRNEAWQSLAVKPLQVRDLYAGPFGLHATLLEFEKHILVMYRGTQDPLDYLLNAEIFTTPGGWHGLPGWVHAGFLTNFSLSWRTLRRTLHEMADGRKSIIFASHSLGGVMSQYAAWRLENEGLSVSRIYAFQAPNPGDVNFKKAFDSRFHGRAFNTLYGDDITPYMPPARESVQAFAGATMRILRGTLSAIVRQAKYASVDGRFEISPQGELFQVPDDTLTESESHYWETYKFKTGGKAFPMGLSAKLGIISDHNINLVLCSLAKSSQKH